MLEKLYQDVYAQVFALTWDRGGLLPEEQRSVRATNQAAAAATIAVKLWDPAKAHAAICDAQGLPAPTQPDAPEGT